MHLLFILLNT